MRSFHKLLWCQCHITLWMISCYWSWWSLGAVDHQAITWASVDSNICSHMAWLCHSNLTCVSLDTYLYHQPNHNEVLVQDYSLHYHDKFRSFSSQWINSQIVSFVRILWTEILHTSLQRETRVHSLFYHFSWEWFPPMREDIIYWT